MLPSVTTPVISEITYLVISRSSSSPNSPPIREGSPTTMTSCEARVNPEVLGDFFLLDVLFMPVLGVDELAFVDLRFRLVLGARGVSAATKTGYNESCDHSEGRYLLLKGQFFFYKWACMLQ